MITVKRDVGGNRECVLRKEGLLHYRIVVNELDGNNYNTIYESKDYGSKDAAVAYYRTIKRKFIK